MIKGDLGPYTVKAMRINGMRRKVSNVDLRSDLIYNYITYVHIIHNEMLS